MLKSAVSVFVVILTAGVTLIPINALGAPSNSAATDQSMLNDNHHNTLSENDNAISRDKNSNSSSSNNSNDNSGASDLSY